MFSPSLTDPEAATLWSVGAAGLLDLSRDDTDYQSARILEDKGLLREVRNRQASGSIFVLSGLGVAVAQRLAADGLRFRSPSARI